MHLCFGNMYCKIAVKMLLYQKSTEGLKPSLRMTWDKLFR